MTDSVLDEQIGAAVVDPPAEWCPTGRDGLEGEWDGHVWTGRSRSSLHSKAPRWRVKAFAFLGHPWFWMFTGGVSVAAVAGWLAGQGLAAPWWLTLAVLGSAAATSSIVALLWPLLRFDEVGQRGAILLAGVVSGAVAVAVAMSINHVVEPAFGLPFGASLWLAGPVEETAKLIVPLLLLAFASRVFGDPRAGVLTVLISGVTFGVVESFEYMAREVGTGGELQIAVLRSMGEMTHATWTATAAVLIWLACRRRGRLLTAAGVMGWVVAAGLHSLNDGFLFAMAEAGRAQVPGTAETQVSSEIAASIASAVSVTVPIVHLLIAVVVSLVVLRYVARELAPPTAALRNPPRWRPRLKQWGVPKRLVPASHERSGSGARTHDGDAGDAGDEPRSSQLSDDEALRAAGGFRLGPATEKQPL